MRKETPKSYDYISGLAGPETEAMQQARLHAESLGLEAISLSQAEAEILRFYAESINAKKIVEIGTLTGLSALYLLKNLPAGGCVWTLEKSPEHAALAARVLAPYIEKKQCRILIGDAREKLNEITAEAPFDAVFIDGNKAAYLDYFNWAVANTRPGGLIIADNVFLAGAVWGDQTVQKFNAKQIQAVQKMNELAFTSPQLHSFILPTTEGLLVCRKMF